MCFRGERSLQQHKQFWAIAPILSKHYFLIKRQQQIGKSVGIKISEDAAIALPEGVEWSTTGLF
jgi:hypothetical protein